MTPVVLRIANVSMRVPRRVAAVNLSLLILLGALAGWRLTSGAFPVSPADFVAVILGEADPVMHMIVIENRLARLLNVIGVGLAFGLAGEMIQTLLRNPLASPDIVGFSAGAGCGAVLSVAIFGSASFVIPGAVLGGALAAFVVVALSWRGGINAGQLVLIGIGTTMTLGVLNELLLTRLDSNAAADLMNWLIGSFDGHHSATVIKLWIGLAILIPVAFLHQFALARITLGDQVARSLGVDPDHARLITLGLGVLLVALAVAAAGPLPFVAFVAGPIAHGLNRAPRPTLLTAALVGATITLIADGISQVLPGWLVLPAGVFTALIGAPVLLWVLIMQTKVRTA